jgi:hypothetical protein
LARTILFIAILGLAQLPQFSKAQTNLDQEIENVDVKSEFGLNPTLKNFERLDPLDRVSALAELLAHQESNSSSEMDLILKRLVKDSPSDLGEVYQLTFQIAIEDMNSSAARRYFQLGVASNPQNAKKYICDAFYHLGFNKAAGDPEIDIEDVLPPHSEQIEVLIPLVAGTPNLQNVECDIYSPERLKGKLSIAKLFAITSSELAAKLSRQIRSDSGISPVLSAAFVRCSVPDITTLANRAITFSNNAELKVGKEIYFSEQVGDCLLNGKIIKRSDGFEYVPRMQNGGYSEQRISFRTGAELAGKIKGQLKK